MRTFIQMFILGVLAVGCSKDATEICDGVICQNGGQCIDGTCNCAEGFTGPNCETVVTIIDSLSCQNGGSMVNGTCQCVCPYYGENCELQITDTAFHCNQTMSYTNTCPDGFIGFTCTSELDAYLLGNLEYMHIYDVAMFTEAPIAVFSAGNASNEYLLQVPADSTAPLLIVRNGLELVVAPQTYKGYQITHGTGHIDVYNTGLHIKLRVFVSGSNVQQHFSYAKQVYIP